MQARDEIKSRREAIERAYDKCKWFFIKQRRKIVAMIVENSKSAKVLHLKNRLITAKHGTFVMGIVNVTSNSFFVSSRGGVERALLLIEEGADLLDIGAESTRPGASFVEESEQLSLLLPVIKAVRKYSDIPISIDTRLKAVFKPCFDLGADMLNDISALEDDEDLSDFCAENEVPVILMHKRGTPQNMQQNTYYDNIVKTVDNYLEGRVQFALNKGIKEDKILLDCGVGFGKDTQGNIALIKNCGRLQGGRFPIVMGLSRKTVIGDITGRGVEERLAGTLCANLIAALKGASVLRVHDVKETVDALCVMQALL